VSGLCWSTQSNQLTDQLFAPRLCSQPDDRTTLSSNCRKNFVFGVLKIIHLSVSILNQNLIVIFGEAEYIGKKKIFCLWLNATAVKYRANLAQ
jgi:hypothetical protein